MFDWFKKKVVKSSDIKEIEDNVNNYNIEHYFTIEINNSPFLKKDSQQIVMKHLLGEYNIVKTNNKLSVEEKKLLGINTRLSITKELVNVLNEEGLKQPDPKIILSDIWNRSTITKSKWDQYNKSKRVMPDVKFNLVSSGGGMGDCEWCQTRQKKKYLSEEDILFFLENKCECKPYSYSFMVPIIKV